MLIDGQVSFVEDLLELEKLPEGDFEILVDRVTVMKDDEGNQFRIADSVQTAFFEGLGECKIVIPDIASRSFSDKFELDGMHFEIPTVNFFSFNNPYGACRTCEGFGSVLGIDPDLVIPDKSISIFEGAIAPWRGETTKKWLQPLLKDGIKFDFPIHRPYEDLEEKDKALLWTGNKYFKGLNDFLHSWEANFIKFNTGLCFPGLEGEQFVRTVKEPELERMLLM